MRRREFITVVGGAATWPLAAHAQKPEGMRRIGFLRAAPPPEHEREAWVRSGPSSNGCPRSGGRRETEQLSVPARYRRCYLGE